MILLNKEKRLNSHLFIKHIFTNSFVFILVEANIHFLETFQ